MPLPVPNLDDRRFQDLVDDAKRLVQRRCPEWTDHNVSDPGVTLIETFAFMVDQLLYRLNRVPDRHYLKFLDLIGVRLFPPAAARADLTFWLSAPRRNTVVVPAGTQVATVRTEADEPVTFTTGDELRIVACSLDRVLTVPAGGEPADRTGDLGDDWIPGFADPPAAGDVVAFGLTDAVPGCAVLLRMDWTVAGRGVDPTDPPLIWEAWTEHGWRPCTVERDTTGGLNRAGEVVLHVPAGHIASVLARRRAGWLRCRLVEAAPGQPFFHAPPRLRSATAATIGGTVCAGHAETIEAETLGLSEGVPGQRFAVARPPWSPGTPRWRSRSPAGTPGRAGRRSRVSPSPGRRTRTSPWTARPARWRSARPYASPTARCGSTARCRRRGRRSACPGTAPVAGDGATWPRRA